MNHISIQSMPKDNLPYEKFVRYGAERLSDAELLAILLRSGTKEVNAIELAQKLLYYGGGSLLVLHHLTQQELMTFPGIGQVKAVQLKAAAELSNRIASSGKIVHVKMNDPDTIADYYAESLRHLKQEHIVLAMFDSASRLIADRTVSVGTISSAVISPREIFRYAVMADAVYLILLHNHPSGEALPSKEDLAFTKRVKEAGEIFGIPLEDHIIIGDRTAFSFRKENLL